VLRSLRKRLLGYEDVSTVVAVGEAPAVALNRVEEAVRDSGFSLDREGSRLTIGGGPLFDHLVVEATEMDGGTRVSIRGHAPPETVHCVLQALAKSRPWTWAPSWD
jgi:hypothetical protein